MDPVRSDIFSEITKCQGNSLRWTGQLLPQMLHQGVICANGLFEACFRSLN